MSSKDQLTTAIMALKAEDLRNEIQKMMDTIETKCDEYVELVMEISNRGGVDGKFDSTHSAFIDKLLGRKSAPVAPQESPLVSTTNPYKTCRNAEDIVKCIAEEIGETVSPMPASTPSPVSTTLPSSISTATLPVTLPSSASTPSLPPAPPSSPAPLPDVADIEGEDAMRKNMVERRKLISSP